MDGATMCHRIHEDPRYKDVAFVIASVMDERVIGRDFGSYDGYIRKPFRMVALVDLVRRTLLAQQSRLGPVDSA
jgi:CheY-like chemotaxis protein